MNIEWNAEKYTEDFSFVHQYGNDVADLIDLKTGSTVLDLGCGNGALTEQLKNKGFHVIGIDASEELLNIARRNCPDTDFIKADATSFSLDESVDAVFSNAVFHWIDGDKQSSMLHCVYNVLRDNGQFVFEFGGQGNNALIHKGLEKAFLSYGYSYKMPFYFPSIGEYASLLENAGFQVRYAVLFDRPTVLKGEHGLRDWIDMFVQTPFRVVANLEDIENIKSMAVNELKPVLYKNGKWYADYVRIRMKAYKA